MEKKEILVTGCNGQLGLSLKSISDKYPQYKFIFTDVEDLDITKQSDISSFLDKGSFYALINCAAYTAVDKAEKEKEAAYNLNAYAPLILSKECSTRGINFIHISTDYVFDTNQNTPFSPIDKTNPKSYYGITKLEGENNIIENCSSKYFIIRTSWLYSEFGSNFVKTMIKLGREREVLNVIYDQIGTPTYAKDLAQVIILCLDKLESCPSQILHYSNEGVCSWYDFARKIMQIKNLSCSIKPILSKEYPSEASRPFYSVLDKTEIKNILSINIPHWEDSLINCSKLID